MRGRVREVAAVSLLAVFFVLVLGAVSCAFIVLSAGDQPYAGLALVGGVFAMVMIAVISASFSNRKSTRTDWLTSILWMQRQHTQRHTYHVRRVQRTPETLAMNQPPTAEQVRDLARDHVRWIPSPSRGGSGPGTSE